MTNEVQQKLSIQIDWSRNPLLDRLARRRFNPIEDVRRPAIIFNSFDQINSVLEAASKLWKINETRLIIQYGDDDYSWSLFFPFANDRPKTDSKIDILEDILFHLEASNPSYYEAVWIVYLKEIKAANLG